MLATSDFTGTPPSQEQQQHRLLNDVYVLLDDCDRRALLNFGITPSQYSVLLLLDIDEGRQLVALADRLLVARSTITRLVAALEAMGLIVRVRDPRDRRAQRVRLTPAGADLRERAHAAHHAALRRWLAPLKDADQRRLIALMGDMRSALESSLAISAERDERTIP
ncbi:MAG: MarR family winged helix-turn-helix transcriptional regulator [Anaerolineae bacterium]|nr:MarR family winged helix-turn-helix transcriptional regulator [Anaerolineae bacterium]